MTQRTSLIEQYNNRDVIAQIYRIIAIAEHGAIESLNVEKTGAIVKLIFTMHDETVHTIEFPANGIVDITSVQNGSTMNVTITLDDGTERTISWSIVPGVTLDTAQTVTGEKTFSALMTLLAGLGITGTVTIDGDTQITNGHGLSVAGDIDSAGTLKGDAAEIRGPVTVAGDITAEGATVSDQADIAGMAIEPNGSKTTISNDNGIESASPMNLTGQVTMTNIPTTSTGVRDTKTVNGTRLQNDLDAYSPMVRDTGNKTVYGVKTFHDRIVGMARYFAGDISESLAVGEYKPMVRCLRSSLSTFRGVLTMIGHTRATGDALSIVTMGAHNDVPTSIHQFVVSANKKVEFFAGYDDTYVYIGIKALNTGIQASAMQLTTIASVGFNHTPDFESYTESFGTAPTITILETS